MYININVALIKKYTVTLKLYNSIDRMKYIL